MYKTLALSFISFIFFFGGGLQNLKRKEGVNTPLLHAYTVYHQNKSKYGMLGGWGGNTPFCTYLDKGMCVKIGLPGGGYTTYTPCCTPQNEGMCASIELLGGGGDTFPKSP